MEHTQLHSLDMSHFWRGRGTQACTKAQGMCHLPHEALCVSIL